MYCVPSVLRCAIWSVRIGENAKAAPASSDGSSAAPRARASRYAASADSTKVSRRATLKTSTASSVKRCKGRTSSVVPSTGSSMPSV